MATNWNENGERHFPELRLGECRSDGAIGLNDTVPGLRFRIENFVHIRAAYGARVTEEIIGQLAHIITEVMEGAGQVELADEGCLRVMGAGASFEVRPLPADACVAWIEKICTSLPCIPLSTTGGRILVWLSGACTVAGTGQDDFGSDQILAPFAVGAVGSDAAWASRYRADMALAVAVADHIAAASDGPAWANALALCWQPIRSASQDGEILYAEGLVRFVESNGQARSAGKDIAALERIGFARPFDHFVADLVFAELERCPDLSLGLNISAQSACWDFWWEDYAARLRAAPDVAERLIIEITETTPIADISAAVKFVSRMRRLGCRIALDDFGAGHMSLRYMWALAPHIVKIDRLFLSRAQHSEAARQTYFHLARLAQSSGAVIVAEGVENDEQAALASEMGVEWQQGYHWGRPAFSKIWSRHRSDTTPRIAPRQGGAQSRTIPTGVVS